MNKPWLLLAGEGMLPLTASGKWIKRFDSRREALEFVKPLTALAYCPKYEIGGSEYDWYEIIDLTTFMVD